MTQVLALRPFVPAEDVAKSKRFYQALGFRVTHEDDSVTVLKLEAYSFILTRFYAKAAAENSVVQMLVRDVDAWWQAAQPEMLVATFGVRRPRAPSVQSWGSKVGFLFDPSGVLWHIAEVPF